MKHLKLFNTVAEFESAKPNLDEPWVTLTEDNKEVHYMETAPAPSDEGVDLGLPSGLKWAKYNVGADTEEGYGLMFQWGSTEGHDFETMESATWSTTPFNNGSSDYDEAYFASVSGTVCPNGILALEYDAAHANMGGDWRMPTKEEYSELLENTTQEDITINEVNGVKFTSKTNSNYIFIPKSGYVLDYGRNDRNHMGIILSSSIGFACDKINSLQFYNEGYLDIIINYYTERYGAYTVRGVK